MPDAGAAGPAENGGPAAGEQRSGGDPSATAEDAAAPMETEEKERAAGEAATEVVKKKRVKKLPVPLKAQVAGLGSKALQVRARAGGRLLGKPVPGHGWRSPLPCCRGGTGSLLCS